MGYSTSESTLISILPDLGDLVRGKQTSWLCEPGKAPKWAYKVREALYIACLPQYRNRYPGLVAAASQYHIIVSGDTVSTKNAANTTEIAKLADPSHVGINQGYEDHGRAVNTSGKKSVFQVIDAWKKNAVQGHRNTPMHFAGADLPENELYMLWEWATKQVPPLMLMVDGENITVGPIERDVVKYSWRPKGVRNGTSTEAEDRTDDEEAALQPVKPPRLEGGEPQ